MKRKVTETEKILDKYFAKYRDAYIIARMCIAQVVYEGVSAPHHTEKYIRKACELKHAHDGEEYTTTDENGKTTTHIKMSMTTAELDADIMLCAQEIRDGLLNGKLSYSDFFKCCADFYPAR